MADSFTHLPDVWQRAIGDFLDELESRSGSVWSKRVYSSVLNRFYADKTDPGQVTRADVTAYLGMAATGKRNQGKPIGPSARNQRITVIRAFYRFASAYEIAPDALLYDRADPCARMRYSRCPVAYKAMSKAELERFFSVLEPPDTEMGSRSRALWIAYFYTSRRRSELLNVRYGDISECVIADKDGTRRPGYQYVFRGVKGKSREQFKAELPAPVYHALMHYWQVSGRLATMQDDSPLFTTITSRQPVKPLSSHQVWCLFHRYAQAANLRPGASPHSLRHSSAQAHIDNGMDIEALRIFMLHSDIGTTGRYLTRLQGVSDPIAQKLAASYGFLETT